MRSVRSEGRLTPTARVRKCANGRAGPPRCLRHDFALLLIAAVRVGRRADPPAACAGERLGAGVSTESENALEKVVEAAGVEP